MKDTRQLRATFLLLLTAVIWGLAFVAQEVGAEYLGTFSFNGIRFLMGAASLIPVIALFERESVDAVKIRRLLGGSLLAGTVLFTASALQQYGVQLGTPAGKAGFITGLYTVIVPLLSLLLFRRKTHALVWVGAVLAVAGLLMLNLDENFNLKIGAGECCLLAGSVMWAVHILVIDKFVTTLSPLKFSLGQFAVCGIESMICALLLALLLSVVPAAVSMTIDARHPRLNWMTETEAMKSNFNSFFCIILWIACAAVVALIAFLLSNVSAAAMLAGLILSVVLLCIGSIYLLNRTAEKLNTLPE